MGTQIAGQKLYIKTLLSEESQAAVFRRKTVVQSLDENGIILTGNNGDIQLIHHSRLPDITSFDIPTIILERIDSAVILSRKQIADKNVIGIIKNTVLDPPELNNALFTYGRYHATIISNLLGVRAPALPDPVHTQTQIDPVNFIKLETGFTYGSYDHLKKLFDVSSPPDNISSRPIEISFAGTVNYGAAEIINIHRRQAINALKKMSAYNTTVIEGRKYAHSMYLKNLCESKICISPWGLGEACYRDYEAILSGCVLVKPDSSFIKSNPNIYQNNVTYVPCKADFSDLETVCSKILANWNDYIVMRKKAYFMIKEKCSDQEVAKILTDIFRRCYARIKP